MVATASVRLGDLTATVPDFDVTDDGECVSCGVLTENCDGRVLWCPECGKTCPLF